MTDILRRFHQRFIKANPRTAAIALTGAAALVVRIFPELSQRLGPLASHESLETITLLLVILQGIFGGDAKDQIPASEVSPDTKVSVSGDRGTSDAG